MNFATNIPIYIQIVEQFKIYIISGKFKPGERIPSVRELAFNLKVNPNTIQKGLQELENLKIIYTERTNGKFVTTDQNLIKKLKEEYAYSETNKYFSNMLDIGLTKKEIIDLIDKIGDDK